MKYRKYFTKSIVYIFISFLDSEFNTDLNEMKFYFAFLIYMGLKSEPNSALYWSKCVIFRDIYVQDRISRNSYYDLTIYLHCIEVPDSSDKLRKISHIIHIIIHIIK